MLEAETNEIQAHPGKKTRSNLTGNPADKNKTVPSAGSIVVVVIVVVVVVVVVNMKHLNINNLYIDLILIIELQKASNLSPPRPDCNLRRSFDWSVEGKYVEMDSIHYPVTRYCCSGWVHSTVITKTKV